MLSLSTHNAYLQCLPTMSTYNIGNYDSLIVRTVAFPVQVAYWTKRSWPPAEIVFHVKFDQWSGDMAVGSCGLVCDSCMTGRLKYPLV